MYRTLKRQRIVAKYICCLQTNTRLERKTNTNNQFINKTLVRTLFLHVNEAITITLLLNITVIIIIIIMTVTTNDNNNNNNNKSNFTVLYTFHKGIGFDLNEDVVSTSE